MLSEASKWPKSSYGDGEIIGAMGGAAEVGKLGIAAVHASAGALSGGINSAISGGNVGMGMATGGISAGIGSYAGQFLPKDFGYQLAGRSAIGGITGGISAELYGGNFGGGFQQGAMTAAAGYIFNCWFHDLIDGIQIAGRVPTNFPTSWRDENKSCYPFNKEYWGGSDIPWLEEQASQTHSLIVKSELFNDALFEVSSTTAEEVAWGVWRPLGLVVKVINYINGAEVVNAPMTPQDVR